MAKTKYEVTYIIKPDIDEDSKKALIDRFDKVVTDNGAEELESKDWGKRRFAYEIEKYREGTYHIMTFVAENQLMNLVVFLVLITKFYVQ